MRLRRQLYSMNAAALCGPLFLDGRTDVAAAFSLRRVRNAYQGALVRVRRSSDSTEQDFGAGAPAINWADILSFIGGGSGFAVAWYDQSGNSGRDFSQSTAAAQPQVVLAANGFPALLGDGVGRFMTTPAFAVAQPISYNTVYRRVTNAQAAFENLFSSSAADAVTLYRKNAGPSGNSMWAGAEIVSNDTAQPTGTRGAVGGVFNGALSLMEVNSATISSFTGDTSTTGLNGLTLFTSFNQGADRFDNAEEQEAIFYAGGGAHTSVQLKADNALQRSGWGF